MSQGMQWPLEAENGPHFKASKKTATLVLQPQELNNANNSNKQGTDSQRLQQKKRSLMMP